MTAPDNSDSAHQAEINRLVARIAGLEGRLQFQIEETKVAEETALEYAAERDRAAAALKAPTEDTP